MPRTRTVGANFEETARARYADLVSGVRTFAKERVRALEKEAAALERSARKGAVAYLKLAVGELRQLERRLERVEKLVAPPRARHARTRTKPKAAPATRAARAAA